MSSANSLQGNQGRLPRTNTKRPKDWDEGKPQRVEKKENRISCADTQAWKVNTNIPTTKRAQNTVSK